jgi:hypothetical protein
MNRSHCRRVIRRTNWMIPSIVLLLIPKCPLCLAAYITLVTGIGIPFAAAAWLRGSLIVLCVASLVWLVTKTLKKA